jgi:hypothetical protein
VIVEKILKNVRMMATAGTTVLILTLAFNNCTRGFQVDSLKGSGLESSAETVAVAKSTCDPNLLAVGHTGLQRLTTRQIVNTLSDLFGQQVELPPLYPRDETSGGYVSLPDAQLMSAQFAEQHLEWMLQIGNSVVAAKPARIMTCILTTAGCPGQILDRLLYLAFRRNTLPAEKSHYLSVFNGAAGTNDQKMAVTIAAVLASPAFLYRELFNPNPDNQMTVYKLNLFELASRLSYFLWETMPDDQLLELARSGELAKPEILKAQIERMTASARIDGLARTMTDQWLNLSKLWNHSLSSTSFPQFTPAMKTAMYEETVAFMKYLIQNDRPISDLMESDYTFATSLTAPLYGLSGNFSSTPSRAMIGALPLSGIATKAAVLAVTSSGDRTSIVKRGLWVNESLLCTHVPEPPPGVINSLPTNLPANATPRDIVEYHRRDAKCSTCHMMLDPPGLALENYDPLGRYRTVYPNINQPIDASSTLANGSSFRDLKGLQSILAANPELSKCVVNRIVPLVSGRKAASLDDCSIESATELKKPTDLGFKKLIGNILSSPIFNSQVGGN